MSSLESSHTRGVLPTLGALLSSVPGCHGDFLMSNEVEGLTDRCRDSFRDLSLQLG